jgi:uncharacterized protein (DUF1800 family)
MMRLLLLAAPWALATSLAAQAPLTAADSARHVLNRLAFGAGPGDIEAVTKVGAFTWAEQQVGSNRPADEGLAAIERRFDLSRFTAAQLLSQQGELRKMRRAQGNDTTMSPATRTMARDHRNDILAYQQLTMVRAITAEDQMREVLIDFWTNHFNVFLNKGDDRALLPEYIETVIRPHALGKFRTLLIATAKSPAMLFYLDNARSVKPGAVPPALARMTQPGRRVNPARQARMDSLQQRMPSGINENYARELMELHTLGVDGGYTQKDITEVARILTGWGINPRHRDRFEYHDWAHDQGAKTVLGVSFPAGKGEDEGVRLLTMLAEQPATMHFVSQKLCARFVMDAAPDGCTDDAVRAWKATDGDILAIMRAIVHSQDFWSARAVESKVKSPLEFVVSAARAIDLTPDTLPMLAQAVARLGQPLFQHSAPTGYPEREQEWVNSGALLARMNFAVALAGRTGAREHRGTGARVQGNRGARGIPERSEGNGTDILAELNRTLFAGRMSETTRTAIAAEIAEAPNPQAARTLATGLALGSPEFQRQ